MTRVRAGDGRRAAIPSGRLMGRDIWLALGGKSSRRSILSTPLLVLGAVAKSLAVLAGPIAVRGVAVVAVVGLEGMSPLPP